MTPAGTQRTALLVALTLTPSMILVPGLALLSGCAGAMKPAAHAPLPATKGEARRELVDLEQRITETRVALGLAARQPLTEPSAAKEAPAGGEAGGAAGPDAASQLSPSSPPPSPAPEPAEAPRAASARVESADAEEADDEQRSHCESDKSCRLTRAICNAAERICRLARFLEEPDAYKRCRRAQQDCRDARQATRDSCSDC